MKSLPNCLSVLRIILSLVILGVTPFRMEFYLIYTICAISDLLDGWIARRMNASSPLGARLDSIADLVMLVVLFLVLYPRLQLTLGILLWLLLIVLIRLSSMVIVLLKFRTFGILHTLGNKVTGIMVFLLPYFILILEVKVLAYLCCAVATLSAMEELLIHLTSKELELDRKGFLLK